MDSFLKNVGLMAICFVIIYGYKKILEYYNQKSAPILLDGFCIREKVSGIK